MIIKRTIKKGGFRIQMEIELTVMEVRTAYYEHQRICRMEDISNHLDAMDESNLYGYTAQEVIDNPKLMELLLESFFKHESCELPENDVMEECIRTVLADRAGARKAAL